VAKLPQIFHRSTNTLSRLSLFSALFLVALFLSVLAEIERSSYITEADVVREQPIQFSHKHHVEDDGIDCRYCHTSVVLFLMVRRPPRKTCMNCHSQIFAASPYLEPIRESFRTGKPIEWTRVHKLPEFVYFNHSIHVNKGVGCASCHGQVNLMPLVRQVASLQMEWCLDCHRHPERALRPREQVFNMHWQPPADQLEQGRRLAREYNIRSVEELTSCSTCHR